MATNTLNQGFIYLQAVKGLAKGKEFPDSDERLYGTLCDTGMYFITRTNLKTHDKV
ncbi:MAG: hypothetical protein ACI4CY_05980 [Candidatus Gastranaerophilaceae bacterium]